MATPGEPSPSSGRAALASAIVLMPAWQPGPPLLPLLDALLSAGFERLVVVDDGSGPAFLPVFQQAAQRPGVVVLRHASNLGKGRALKTGMHYILHKQPSALTVVTADADGQHTSADIVRVALTAVTSQAALVLGTRAFTGRLPLRSRLGNALTRTAFNLLTGVRLGDTQTGLRAIARTLLPELVTLDGERYEYELTVLAHLCRAGVRPAQVAITTVYLDNNRSSHFRPVRDSIRIYCALLRLLPQWIKQH